MKLLEEKLRYTFRNINLLSNALTHSSYANEHRDAALGSNERLEFLGDSVLGMVVAEHLYRTRTDLPEGSLTRLRAALVCEGSLAEAAELLGLGQHLKLGRGEEAGGGRTRPSILADALEAVLAAVYLDGGIAQARRLVEDLILKGEQHKFEVGQDYKTLLQELVQRENGRVLTYRLAGQYGPDHDKRFAVEVDLDGVAMGSGEGRSKKEAEQAAAHQALERISG